MNKVIITGCITSEPTIVQLDQPMLKFNMLSKESNGHEEVHGIRVYGNAIEAFKSHLSIGDEVLVEGKIRNIKWLNADNSLMITPCILAVKIEYLDVKSQKMELNEA